jgi:hypothetical protein
VKVDKYGRKIAGSHEKGLLRKFYRLPDDGQEDESKRVDYARGEGLMESSEEEEDVKESDEEEDIIIGEDASKPIAVLEEEAEIDLDESQFAALDALAEANLGTGQITGGTTDKATTRLAVVNLDWDHVKAGHLFKIFSSQLSISLNSSNSSSKQRNGTGPTNGRLLYVRVYPSEFGKKRMAEEDKNGPPADLFREKGKDKSEEVDGDVVTRPSNGEEYDQDALRRYQLERLRYIRTLLRGFALRLMADTITQSPRLIHLRRRLWFMRSWMEPSWSGRQICLTSATYPRTWNSTMSSVRRHVSNPHRTSHLTSRLM